MGYCVVIFVLCVRYLSFVIRLYSRHCNHPVCVCVRACVFVCAFGGGRSKSTSMIIYNQSYRLLLSSSSFIHTLVLILMARKSNASIQCVWSIGNTLFDSS